jgi:hypothetical protein
MFSLIIIGLVIVLVEVAIFPAVVSFAAAVSQREVDPDGKQPLRNFTTPALVLRYFSYFVYFNAFLIGGFIYTYMVQPPVNTTQPVCNCKCCQVVGDEK